MLKNELHILFIFKAFKNDLCPNMQVMCGKLTHECLDHVNKH